MYSLTINMGVFNLKLVKLTTKEEPKLYSKEELCIAVEKFVYKICNKYTNIETFSDPFDEILSIALISFTKAYESYDINSKRTFLSYLSILIRNDVLNEYKYSKKGKIYYNNRKKEELSMEAPIGIDKDGNEVTFLDIISNKSITNSEINYMENKEMMDAINFCINNILLEREKIILYYKLEGLSQRKMVKLVGISQPHISRSEKKIYEKIRKYLKKNKLI